MKLVYSVVMVITGFTLGSSLPGIIQTAIGKLFGGVVSLDYDGLFWPIEAEFHDSTSLRDWQIRLVGASKLIFPASLLIYLLIIFPQRAEYRYVVFTALFVGSATISWTDLLAIENPKGWSMNRTGIYAAHGKNLDMKPDFLPDFQDRLVTYVSFIVLLGIGAAFFLEYQGVLDLVKNSDNPPYEFATVSNIIGGVGSVIFSIILVALYDKQASISDTQSRIQEEQAELMRRERQPRLSGPYNTRFWGSNVPKQSKLNSSTTTDPRSKSRDPNPNSIQFFQTNAGEGLAQNFKLKILLNVLEGPHDGRGAVCAVQRMDRFPLRKFGESDLQGGEKDVEFMTENIKLSFTEPNPGDLPSFDTYGFEEGINKLVKQGTTEISLAFTLVWEDEFEKEYSDQVYQTTADITHNMDLLDVVEAL